MPVDSNGTSMEGQNPLQYRVPPTVLKYQK